MVCQSCIKTVIYNVSTYWSSSAIVGVYLAPQGSYLTSAYIALQELTLKLEQMQETASKKRRALDSEVTETLTAQIGLDKTAEAFRQSHRDRQDLIEQWEQTIDQMKRRDQEMDRCATVRRSSPYNIISSSRLSLCDSMQFLV